MVLAGDRLLPATVVKAGDYETIDVTLLSVARSSLPPTLANLTPLELCQSSPTLGQSVTVIEYASATSSVIISPDVLPPSVSYALSTLIADVYTTGNSGSGVFDDASGCLMGIMSRKIERLIVTNDAPIRADFDRRES